MISRARYCALILGLLFSFAANGGVWYVDKDNASGVEDGTSWAAAFTGIQPAIDAAYAAFEEEIKGSIEPGKLADLTVFSRDLMTIPEQRILDTEVVYTIVGGEVMYQREER